MSNDVDDIINKTEDISIFNDTLKAIQSEYSSTRDNLDGTSGYVRKLSPYDNVADIHWTLGKYCHFIALDAEVVIPVSNRWELHADQNLNNYIHMITYPGQYRYYVRYYEEGRPTYPMRTDREICIGGITVNTISTTDPVEPSVECNHDYSKISFGYYEILGNGNYVVFGGIICTDSYRLVLSSPNIQNFELVQEISAMPGTREIQFSLRTPDLYNLKIYSNRCTNGYQNCKDYRVIQFSTAIPHMGKEPLYPFN